MGGPSISGHRIIPQEDAATVQSLPAQSTISQEAAKQRVENYFGHHYDMLSALESQSTSESPALASDNVKNSIKQIYETANQELKKIEASITRQLNEPGKTLSKKEIKNLKKELQNVEKQTAEIIHKTQVATLTEIAKSQVTMDKRALLEVYIKTITAGGWKAKILKAKSHLPFFFPGAYEASKAFKTGKETLEAQSRKSFDNLKGADQLTSHQAIQKEFATDAVKALSKRAGVVAHGDAFRFSFNLDRKKIRKQIKSFHAQNISQKTERKTIEHAITQPVGTPGKVATTIVPLNSEFDNSKGITSVFGRIFGSAGLSSMNRFEPHVINAAETGLTKDGKLLFTGLRHAILSSKLEKDPELRAENSRAMAKELVQAAVIQQISGQGGAFPETSREHPFVMDFMSVSLVTPDLLSKLKDGDISERVMLKDQENALKSLSGVQEFQIGDKTVFVQVNPMPFNYGVNAGAVGAIKPLLKKKLGLDRQHVLNKESFKKLEARVGNFLTDDRLAPSQREHVQVLWKDIQEMSKTKSSYLKGGNQYELGAKLLILSNLLNRTDQGSKCAFNCKSGKDRTGEMDAMVKAFALIGDRYGGRIPTSQEFRTSEALRAEFLETLVTLLKEGGGLEWASLNTGVRGYKLSEEAKVWGMKDEDFREIQGLSKMIES